MPRRMWFDICADELRERRARVGARAFPVRIFRAHPDSFSFSKWFFGSSFSPALEKVNEKEERERLKANVNRVAHRARECWCPSVSLRLGETGGGVCK
jgi:hypothetical protein